MDKLSINLIKKWWGTWEKVSSSISSSWFPQITRRAFYWHTRLFSSFLVLSTNLFCITRSETGRFETSEHSTFWNVHTSFRIASFRFTLFFSPNASLTDGSSSANGGGSAFILNFQVTYVCEEGLLLVLAVLVLFAALLPQPTPPHLASKFLCFWK